jgi:exopolyphosphatase/guanosine-5'-triphosphate,3'-diphosphate pyrophosphatase
MIDINEVKHMKYGVIDLGSNTVRLSIYETQKTSIKLIYSIKEVVSLASFVNEDDYLTNEGIQKAIDVVTDFRQASKQFHGIELHCIVTAAIRNSKNCNDVLKRIEKTCNIKVTLLSSYEEAMAGVLGITMDYDIDEGIVLDIGGGSSEVTYLKHNEVATTTSIPFGALNSYMKFVKDLLPIADDEEKIRSIIASELKTIQLTLDHPVHVYGMGGTINSINKLLNVLVKKTNNRITYEDLVHLKSMIKPNDKGTYLTLIKHTPDRIHTLVPGLIILMSIMEYFNSKTIFVSKRGIREGYIRGLIHQSTK